ncbi:MAG: hydroxyacid dehydrogenase [candidate division Zixibacteria bacterium]|nr:hydroxyacid dehydrogenase [candidate division Zixibacteria bacterium]NIR62380.1 hydroxyacid dehydrogenase [candidate division Zixibacteria bacterium]NIS14989.1 hydroxyacid dehydrogenase [candidate division Zixibacteria bacterium]NIS44556.1 hydroxyacid dehydrogenase [candidate division Zixibacteria bacterium]NIT51513.1 hydroxyacid dehydrogenase [candidate division Zixibacteria bacterium]
MKILISDAFDPGLPDKLKRFGEVTDDKSRLADCEVVLVRSKTKCTKEYIDSAPKLKLIIRGGVGLDNIDRPYAAEKGIKVFNTAAASSIAVAELAFALMIALPNHIVKGHESMVKGEWIKKQLKRTELYRKTLGIFGCGRIGSEIAKRARAFGMKVVGYDPFLNTHDTIEIINDLDVMLPKCDYISLNTPLTDETAGMINKKVIAKMKDGVYIVNTGRGKVVVEEDVAAALESGKIAGYGNDVWYSDPPESTPLAKAPNTTLTPHIGASTKENLLRIGDIIEELIGKYVDGKLD